VKCRVAGVGSREASAFLEPIDMHRKNDLLNKTSIGDGRKSSRQMSRGAFVDLQFIGALTDTQRHLQSEWAMNEVETICRKRQYSDLEPEYLQHSYRQKKHYMLIYLLLYSPHGKIPPLFSEIIQDASTFVTRPDEFRTFRDVSAAIQQGISDELLDALTFSLLPAYFQYFLTQPAVPEFGEFVNSVTSARLYRSLARVAFFSPFFLAFAADVFGPLISRTLPHESVPSEADLRTSIIERWTENARQIPPFVRIFLLNALRADVPPELVLSQFFEIVLQRRNLCMLGVGDTDPSSSEPRILDPLRLLLNGTGQTSILSTLVAITSRIPGEFPLLDQTNLGDVPELTASILVSTFDLSIHEALFNNVPLAPLESWKVYAAKKSRVPKSEHLSIERTLVLPRSANRQPIKMISPALRHLLQGADPIPQFKCAPADVTIEEFFVDYLRESGPRESFAAREHSLEIVRKYSRFDRDILMDCLGRAKLERVKVLRALSAFTGVLDKLGQLSRITESITVSFADAVQFRALASAMWASNIPRRAFGDYVANPALFAQDCRLLVVPAPLALQFLCNQFSFERWLAAHPEMQSRDERLRVLLEDHLDDVIRRQVDRIRHADYFLERIEVMKRDRRMTTILWDAAAEASPLRKLEGFDRGITVGFASIMGNLLTDRVDVPGPDETWPLRLAVLLVARIPHLVSNVEYMRHFYGMACLQDGSIERRFMSLSTAIELVKQLASRYMDD
jgi:hypothetical protein